MKTIINQFGLLKSENKQNRFAFFTLMLFFFFSDNMAIAQNTSGSMDMNSLLNNWLLGGLAVVFFGMVIYVLRTALAVLHDNGKTVEFSFPIFKNMAENNKTVTTIILIIVVCGILWAVSYGG